MDDEVEYEYRMKTRFRDSDPNGIFHDEDWSPWRIIYGNSRYTNLPTVRGLASKMKNRNLHNGKRQFECLIQRRPLEEGWEDAS